VKKPFFLILTFIFISTGIFAQTQKEIFDNGVLLFKKGQYQDAIDAFSKLIELAQIMQMPIKTVEFLI